MIKTGKELAAACVDVANNYKTLYVLGCFGWPMNTANKERTKSEYAYNRNSPRGEMIDKATADTFGFDCVNLIKALLWGWNGNKNASYGGATYKANGVPDIDESAMINVCKGVSTDFTKIEIGEAVWMPGHIGVYIGDGLAVECTPIWENGVQITACNCSKAGYNRRDWKKHGKLPYVEYPVENVENPSDSVKVGDIVDFTGTRHYISAYTGTGSKCNPGKATVTAIKEGAQHPYHLVKVAGGTATVHGWVDAKDIEKKAEPAPEPAAKCNLSIPELKEGAKGTTVKALQTLLIANDCSCGRYGADGEFGAATELAVMMFQDRNGLEPDGICGVKTWAKLLGV